ncbi:MAG: hypothetical protein C7B44_11925 [Sulfobacillus thermosulfidooxidans]|nr:MAG: hypothetical protein C7B44_11925 [Sulfobacillus thermosulfidooxidans]
MRRYFWPITSSALSLILAAVLTASPWLYMRHASGPWNQTTQTFFWTGLGMILISGIALTLWIRQLRQQWTRQQITFSQGEAPDQAISSKDIKDVSTAREPKVVVPESEEERWERELRQLAQDVLLDISQDHQPHTTARGEGLK